VGEKWEGSKRMRGWLWFFVTGWMGWREGRRKKGTKMRVEKEAGKRQRQKEAGEVEYNKRHLEKQASMRMEMYVELNPREDRHVNRMYNTHFVLTKARNIGPRQPSV